MQRHNTKKYAFYLLQSLANTYNVQVIRIYWAAGHGKGLVDPMSSFEVKPTISRDIIIMVWNQWFQISSEICGYFQLRGGKRMCYINIDANLVDSIQKNEYEWNANQELHDTAFVWLQAKQWEGLYKRVSLWLWAVLKNFNFNGCVKEQPIPESLSENSRLYWCIEQSSRYILWK